MNVSATGSDAGDVKAVLWPAELSVMLRLGQWTTPDQVLSAALDALLATHPNLREEVAVELFRQELVSLARAAELAGTDQWSFRELLRTRKVPLSVEVPETAMMDDVIHELTGHNG